MLSARFYLTHLWFKPALILTLLFTLPVFIFHLFPYDERAGHVLIQEDCAAPCFLGIQPGITTMQGAVYKLDGHDWVATNADNFPSQVQQAVYFDAAVPRIQVQWRWSAALPDWIDETENGGLTFEDRGVREITLNTHLSLGEILLAFGEPDESQISPVFTADTSGFQYMAWYADEGMVIGATSPCPIWNIYTAPVWIRFRPDAPTLPEMAPKDTVC
jgi:hypothetical protein